MIKQTNKGTRFLRILWLVPILVMAYIGWVNLIPLGGTITYFIDVGGEDTQGKAVVTGPFDRISDKKEINGTSFRDLEKNLVYFELEDLRPKDANEIRVSVRFKDNFPAGASFIVGARNKEEWSYYWKESYIPFYEKLIHLPSVSGNETVKVYAMANGGENGFQSVDDFLQNPPVGSVIASNDKSLSINQRLSQEESGEIDASEFAARDVFHTLSVGDTNQNGYLETDTSLRGPHDFYFLSDGGTLELRVAKRDLNWYEGEDALNVIIYSLDGTFKAMTTMPDDGDSTKGKNLGPSQYQTLKADNLERGAYRLKLVGEGSDFVITHLELNQSKLVVPGKVFLAGNLYLGGELEPMVVWCYLFSDGEIKFSTAHKSALQNVTISGEGYNQTINIDSLHTEVSTGLLKAGIYKITSEKGDLLIKVPSGYCTFTENSLFIPVSGSTLEGNGTLLINTTLRGGHTLWTYVTNAPLELTVTKQDLNWYDGPDELAIEVYSFNGEPKGSAIIPDDGNEGKTKNLGPLQHESLKIEGLEPGAYRLELKGGSDLLIRGIEINQAKLVVDGAVYLTSLNLTYFEDGLAFDPVRLYTKNFTASQIKFHTWHNSGLQQVSIQGNTFDTEIDINKLDADFSTNLMAGSYQLIIPRQDVLIESKGYFSFTPDSFFLPQRCKVIDLKYDLSWLKDNADYILMSYGDYAPPVEDDGWLVAHTSWKREDLFIEDDKLSFCLSAPHLTKEPDKPVPVDWIEIHLKILPLFKRFTLLDHFLD